MTEPKVDRLEVAAFQVPTEQPESDGTLQWDCTTLVVVHVCCGPSCGLGYSYCDVASACLIDQFLRPRVLGSDALAPQATWAEMCRAVRNMGRAGVVSAAISAVDAALWDLKAQLLHLPLVQLLGPVRSEVDVYGSGGFTSYSADQLAGQLAAWVDQGIERVKMKVGRRAREDPDRVSAARKAIGENAELFVDANGAYRRKEALEMAEIFAQFRVKWFEEPVSSDDLDGLRLLRDRAPAGMEIAAGEYGYDLFYFSRMIRAQAVDVLMADATRCGGITGIMQVGALCQAEPLPLSTHTAPSLHTHVACALPPVCHVEYFHDHARLEQMLFEGAPAPQRGKLSPDLQRPGMGLQIKWADARRFQVYPSAAHPSSA